jgi:hypothetical protein
VKEESSRKMIQLIMQMTSVQMVGIVPSFLFILSFVAFLAAIGYLWKIGKTVESMLVWVSMWLYIVALILLLK